MMLKRYAEYGKKCFVDFKRNNSPAAAGKWFGQRAKSRANLQYAILFGHKRMFSKLFEQCLIFDKILSQAVLMMEFTACLSIPIFQSNIPFCALFDAQNIRTVRFSHNIVRTLFDFQIGFRKVLSYDAHTKQLHASDKEYNTNRRRPASNWIAK